MCFFKTKKTGRKKPSTADAAFVMPGTEESGALKSIPRSCYASATLGVTVGVNPGFSDCHFRKLPGLSMFDFEARIMSKVAMCFEEGCQRYQPIIAGPRR